MPIYEYACRECGHSFDALQKVSDDPLSVCPECGEEALRKLVSAPVFRLKGSGWYETDFKTGNKHNLHGDGGNGADKADGGGKKEKTDGESAAPASKKQAGGAGVSKDSGSQATGSSGS